MAFRSFDDAADHFRHSVRARHRTGPCHTRRARRRGCGRARHGYRNRCARRAGFPAMFRGLITLMVNYRNFGQAHRAILRPRRQDGPPRPIPFEHEARRVQ